MIEWLLFLATTYFGLSVVVANVLARAAGATLGFWSNARFTFTFASAGAVLGRRTLLRFLVSWLLITLLGNRAVKGVELSGGLRLAWVGKPLVDIVSAGLGFLVAKYWIFRGKSAANH